MAIRVAPGAEDLACDLAGSFLLQIVGPSHPDEATVALGDARADLLALVPAGADVQPFVSNAVLGPSGPLLRVAGLDVGERPLAKVPDLVTGRLARAGVTDAVIEVLEDGRGFERYDATSSAVVLRLYPTRADGGPARLPAHWIDVAAEWVLGGLPGSERVALRLLGAAYDTTVADTPGTLHHAARARTWCDLVQGDPQDRLRSASLSFGRTPHLALAAGGPGCDAAALLARFDLLCDLARELSGELTYACVDLEDTFADVGTGFSADGWPTNGGAPPNEVASLVGDVCVPDAFPFQVLGPGHVARLAAAGDRKPIGTPLADGRVEVTIGDAVDWLPQEEVRDEQLELGWKVLSALLLTEAELRAMTKGRGKRRAAAPAEATAVAVAASGPDLDEVVLEAVPHTRRGLHLTLLELAAWLGHEPHGDDPATVSPVLRALGRWLAAAVDDDRRQALVPIARRLVGTSGRSALPGAWRGLSDTEDERAWGAADWLLGAQLPAWLRLADDAATADKLAGVRRRQDHGHAARATALAGGALQALAAVEGDETADEHAWRAWEHAADRSGWVAASEAALVAVPRDLAEAVELRVLDLTREPRSSVASLVAEAQAAGAAAAAQAAWEAGWAAMRAIVDGDALVPLDTALERSRQAATGRLDVRRDDLDHALDAAASAGRAAIAAIVGDGGDPGAAWIAAMDDAAESETGATWRLVQELATGIVGTSAWEAGTAAAATAAARVVGAAPGLVQRAVTVTIAREASGAAARTVARTAAADVLRSGGTPEDAGTAAEVALAPSSATLTDAALVLLEELIAPRSARPA